MLCATSLTEFTVGQSAKVVVGMGCVASGKVVDLTPVKVWARFDDGREGLYRPYQVMPGPLPVGQLGLFRAGT